MKLFTWIIMGCYMTMFVALGIGLIAFSLHWVPVEGAILWLQNAYEVQNWRLACLLAGVGLILLNWMILELTINKLQRQKTIAFENPDGQVTVSLIAIEDFVRKITRDIPEVKELRSDVVAQKGRILVRVRTSLWSDAHIPDVAEKIQSGVKTKVQEMLSGVEDPVLVKVHVSKIAHREIKGEVETTGNAQSPEAVATPFRSY